MMLSILTIIAVIGSLSACAYYLIGLTVTAQFGDELRRIAASGFTPPVTILKPLCGADPHAYESLRSHCVQDYPDFEIIFGISNPQDVVVELVQRLVEEFPLRNIRLVVCPERFGTNFKISNLVQMFPHARHEYILVNDSDIHVQPGYLRRVMAEFENPKVGMVTCLYRGVAGTTLGSRLEALGINADFIPGVLTARRVEGGIHFALGSTLCFRRGVLASIGGFESVADYLGDDYELGKRVSDTSFLVALAKDVVAHYIPDYTFPDYLRHQLRWARTVHGSRPGGFAGLIFTFGFFWATLALIAMNGMELAWALIAVVLFLRFVLAFRAGRILGDHQIVRQFWLLPIRDLLAVGIWAASYTGRRIVWRGNQFTLENGKLRP